MKNSDRGRVCIGIVMAMCWMGCGNGSPPTVQPDGGMPTVQPDGGMPTAGPRCTQSAECMAEQACVQTQCVGGNGSCSTDNDCGADSYCCQGPCLQSASDTPICLPYGTGPRGSTAPVCEGAVSIGQFTPDIQCAWRGPEAGDPYPNDVNVLSTPLVADLPYDSGAAAEIIMVTDNVIRVLNGQTCEQIDVFTDWTGQIGSQSGLAIGDLDAPGVASEPEIVTFRNSSSVVAFEWNAATGGYVQRWENRNFPLSRRIGAAIPSIHDINNDGTPEVLVANEVYEGARGTLINPTQGDSMPADRQLGFFSARGVALVADLDNDGAVELVHGDVFRWNTTTNRWDRAYDLPDHLRAYYAVADFGTAGTTAEDFQVGVFDGRAEIVAINVSLHGHTEIGEVSLFTLEGQTLMKLTNASGGVRFPIGGGSPPTIGDFDNDGVPEFATAGGPTHRVFDLGCAPNGPQRGECVGDYIRWEQPLLLSTTGAVGSSIFDFDSDGKTEAVNADDCFTRIHEGSSGAVLYSSYRTSSLSGQTPVIADTDKDSNTEIVVAYNYLPHLLFDVETRCPRIDPIHPGLTCEDGNDCQSGACDGGYCRCSADSQCGENHRCEPPLTGTAGRGNTCRAYHPPLEDEIRAGNVGGIRVLRDSLDRWASSRPLWNQHAYSITNINDDLSVPRTSSWVQNFSDPDTLNNYRQNSQGDASATDLPDITGKLDLDTLCAWAGTFTATVCNRGKRAVGSLLPATFYDDTMAVICTSFTEEPVPIGECRPVSCDLPMSVGGLITMIVNDDGNGGRTTVECNTDNNTDSLRIGLCPE